MLPVLQLDTVYGDCVVLHPSVKLKTKEPFVFPEADACGGSRVGRARDSLSWEDPRRCRFSVLPSCHRGWTPCTEGSPRSGRSD